jgi:hypothetical protein
MEKIINRLIDDAVKGIDVYHYKGSVWLIFTDKKEWVVELQKNGLLWYNYYFFENIFKYVSMDVVKNQHYIAKWVEDILKNEVRGAFLWQNDLQSQIEDTIQNGVTTTCRPKINNKYRVEDTIQNGDKLNDII